MSDLTDCFSVVDASFVIEGIRILLNISGSEVLGGLSCDAPGCVIECLCQQAFQGLLSHFHCSMGPWIQNQAGNVIDIYVYALNH